MFIASSFFLNSSGVHYFNNEADVRNLQVSQEFIYESHDDFKLFLKMTQVINTVSVYRSLLQEEDYDIKLVAIQQLLANISLHWTDIANDINTIEELLEDPEFKDKELVAILLAKIYFYLNEYDESLSYALRAGKYFEIDGPQNDFTDVLIHKAIEKYIRNAQEAATSSEQKQYKKIVDIAIENSISKNDLKSPLGIALDTRDQQLFSRIAQLMEVHKLIEALLPHLLTIDISFRGTILEVVTKQLSFSNQFTPSQYINILQVLYAKGDFENASRLIYECLKNNRKEIAYTLALEVSEMHGFNKKVLSAVPIENQMEAERKVLEEIIDGKITDQINNTVLKHLAKTDPYYQTILKKIEPKNSIAHGSAIMGLSFLQAYTQDDSFLQKEENLAWAGKCSHWSKFSSIASLGLIFKNLKDKQPVAKFLPGVTDNTVANYYPNGGSLYALGLLYTGTSNPEIVDQIIDVTTNPSYNQNEVIMHGACLGLGLTAFASGNEVIGERLKDIINASNSVMGEASALALGLTFAGTNNEAIISDLIAIAQDTEHEKTLRSICLSIGLICFGSPSLDFLETLEQNANLKWALPFYMASAYFKSSNPTIVRKLLKLSNDISNEVKRTSIIALGFVMYQDDKLIDIIKMLLYSYNPFIRYGCVMALAIGCKDTKEAIELIWPLLSDNVDFVRQGVYVSLSLLMQVNTNNSEPKLEEFRKNMQEIVGRTHVEIMAKMGAILSVGILDIGGRNMTISLTTRSGMPKIEAITGMLVFCQYWNWFPYLNFIGLAITPSVFIGVTPSFKIPKEFQIKSNCKPSLFDYPSNIVVEDKKNESKKEAAKELSTTNKAKFRAALKKKDSDMDAEIPSQIAKKPSLISHKEPRDESVSQQKIEIAEEKPAEEKKQEESFSVLNNPVRVAERQRKYIKFLTGRFTPVLQDRVIGINFLYDSDPNAAGDFLSIGDTKDDSKMDAEPLQVVEQEKPQEEDMAMPEEFEYDEGKQLLDKKKE